ncbi:MAG: ABC transporter permease [Acidobacteria bacterium]|nr:ABC transporter permease [Acidobacteriota bacterium]
MRDLRYAVRTLLKAPGFTAVAVLTIALGIGATTAIFTIVNALLLRPLPYPHADRLVMVWQDRSARGGPVDEWASPGNVLDWQNEPGLFDGLAAMGGWGPTLTGEGEADTVPGEQVSHQYFGVLGVLPAAGRGFAPEDDVPNAPRVVMISEGFWQRRFGGDPGILGRTLMLTGEPHEVIGVVPAGFRPILNSAADVWRPLRLNLAAPSRGSIFLRVVALMPAGSSLEQTRARASSLALRLQAEHPDYNIDVGFTVQPLHDRVVGDLRPALLALLGGVAFVLLIACTNVANLLMARGSSRGRELAVRTALGASRARVVGQLLTESLVLASLGGLAGMLIAFWAVEALVGLAPAGTPRLSEIAVDRTILGFAFLLTLATGLLFGAAPAFQHSRVDLTHSLKDGGRGATAGGQRLRRGLVAAEVALAVVLLTGGVLLIQTFARLNAADLGFRTDTILFGGINPPAASYPTREQFTVVYDQLLERASAIPGVRRAALTSVLPLAQGDSDMDFRIEGRPAATSSADATVSWYREVSAGYFDTIGMRIARGRAFEPGEAPPSVVINETFAARHFPGEDPLGRRLRWGGPESPWFTIVGVAADARVRGAREPTRVELFIPYWQWAERGIAVVLEGPNAAQFAPALRDVVASIDPNMPVSGVRTMDEVLRESLGQARFVATLSGAFAGLALLLAAVGIYGVMAYAMSQRRTEIGVRMALGATISGVFRLVVGDGLRLALLGTVLGIGGAVVMGRWIQTLLYGVEPTDVGTLALTAVVLLGVAAAASVIPAWRASRVDPMVALRAE